jgi:hypothetical protein
MLSAPGSRAVLPVPHSLVPVVALLTRNTTQVPFFGTSAVRTAVVALPVRRTTLHCDRGAHGTWWPRWSDATPLLSGAAGALGTVRRRWSGAAPLLKGASGAHGTVWPRLPDAAPLLNGAFGALDTL